MDYGKIIEDLEKWIREGEVKRAHDSVHKLNYSKIPYRHRLSLSDIAWRSGAVIAGLKILTPVVHSEQAELRQDVTDEQKVGYAVLLQKIGSSQEAFRILQTVDSHKTPKALLYKCFCLFSQWRYRESLDLLREYVEMENVTAYSRVVGKVNLLSALITTSRWDEAEALLAPLKEELKRENHRKLYGNSLELEAQIHLGREDYTRAKQSIEESQKILMQDNSFGQLFVQKWNAIIDSTLSGDPSRLLEFRKEAEKRMHWETLREVDLYSLKIEFDEEKFRFLTYGTPYPEYHNRIQKILGLDKELEGRVLIGSRANERFDLYYGTLNGSEVIKPGKKIHQLLYCLSSDLYKFQTLGAIFSQVFPDESFNIFSSPNKIYQLTNRLRKWTKRNDMGIEVVESHGSYSLLLPENLSIVADLQKNIPDPEEVSWRRFMNGFEGPSFKKTELMGELEIPLTNAHRLVQWAQEAGHIQKQGVGKSSYYQILERAESFSKAS